MSALSADRRERLESIAQGASSADIIIKAFDLSPPLVTVLYDTFLSNPGKPLDLTSVSAVKMIWKGLITAFKTGSMTKLTVVTPTGNFAINSNIIQSISSFSNIVKGSSLYLPGTIPLGAIVGDFDSTLNTITMTDNQGNALNALANGTTTTFTANRGTVQYQWVTGDTSAVDTYSVEFEMTLAAGPQTVPNGSYRTMQIVADLEGA